MVDQAELRLHPRYCAGPRWQALQKDIYMQGCTESIVEISHIIFILLCVLVPFSLFNGHIIVALYAHNANNRARGARCRSRQNIVFLRAFHRNISCSNRVYI